MAKKKKTPGAERLLISMPKALVADLEKYAKLVRKGKKSGLIQDALRAYFQAIDEVVDQPEELAAAYAERVKRNLAADVVAVRRKR